MAGFKALGLSSKTLEALKLKGFENPSEIQELTIPLLLKGQKNIVGQAQTGSGKTAAFGLPVIEQYEAGVSGVQSLILTPTRELALQITQEMVSYAGDRKIRIATIYGGAPVSGQIKELERGVGIVVGTPGRVIDLMKRRKLRLDEVRFVVLDEADEMLNMGFIEDVELIISQCSEQRRMLLFSATMPSRILSLAERYMGEYDLVQVRNKPLITQRIEQTYVEVRSDQRFEALCRILEMEGDFYGIVFCNMKVEVMELTTRLNEKGYMAESLHGDVAQNLREKVIRQFKSLDRGLLVATDVAARGLDVQDLTHVINYGLPQDPESYVHRIGRTGRAGKAGKAISIIRSGEGGRLGFIERRSHATIKKEVLPGAEEMVDLKKKRLHEKMGKVFSQGAHVSFMTYSEELIEKYDAQTAVAVLLSIFQGEAMDADTYTILQQMTTQPWRTDRRGTRRKKSGSGRKSRHKRRKHDNVETIVSGRNSSGRRKKRNKNRRKKKGRKNSDR